MFNKSRLVTSIYLSLSFCSFVGLAHQAHAYVSREEIIKHNRALAAGEDVEDDSTDGIVSDEGDALAPPMAHDQVQVAKKQEPISFSSQDEETPTNKSDLVVRLLDRVDAQERNMRDLRGQFEALRNEVHQRLNQNEKNLGDLKFQVDEMGKRLKSTSARPTTAAAKTVSKTVAPAKLSAEAIARKNLAAAKTVAQKAQAQYALARALGAQKSYKQAAVSYYEAYRQSPKSSIAPKALLGLSESMGAMNNKIPACQALSKLKAEFPTLSQPLQEQAKRISIREKCE